MTNTFKLGDVVKFNSGSPSMTIVGLNEDTAWCSWYDFNTNRWYENQAFPLFALIYA